MGTVMGDKSISFRSLFAALLALALIGCGDNHSLHPFFFFFFLLNHLQSYASIQAIETDSEAHGALWLITAAAARVAAYRFNACSSQAIRLDYDKLTESCTYLALGVNKQARHTLLNRLA